MGEFTGCTGSWSRRRRRRTAAARARRCATVASTVISPSVSKARKSTRMTLTMLRPCPSVGPNSAKYSRSRGAVSVVATDSSRPPMKVPMATAITASRARTSRDDSSPSVAEMPEHEHVDEDGQRLDRELRHRQVGRAEAQEHHRHAVADRAQREHRRHGRCGRRWRRSRRR